MINEVIIGNEDYFLVYPKRVKDDVARAINTMGFIDKEIPNKTLSEINKDLEDVLVELDDIDKKIKAFEFDNRDFVENIEFSRQYYQKAANIKQKMVKGNKFLYFSAWVANSKIDIIKKLAEKYDNTIVNVKSNNHQEDLKIYEKNITKSFSFLSEFLQSINFFNKLKGGGKNGRYS